MKNRSPPLLVMLATGVVMFIVARSPIGLVQSIPFRNTIAASLVVLGIAIAVIAARQFAIARTTVNPLKPETTTALVSTGIFSLSRNPMYVGMLLVLAGWAVHLGSVINIAMLTAFGFFITQFQIKPEEAAMRSLFGQAFDDYCQRVRRWL